jgi:hypothetical protein
MAKEIGGYTEHSLHNTMYCLAFIVQTLVTGLLVSHCTSL